MKFDIGIHNSGLQLRVGPRVWLLQFFKQHPLFWYRDFTGEGYLKQWAIAILFFKFSYWKRDEVYWKEHILKGPKHA